MIQNLAQAIWLSLSAGILSVQNYLPNFVAGLILLIIGIVLAKVAAGLVVAMLRALRVGKFLVQIKVMGEEGQFRVWEVLLSELTRWTVIILFLVPAVETWGLSKVTDILNNLILYLPNVFVAVIVGLVGFVVANLTADVVRQSAMGLDEKAAKLLSGISYYAILFFTALVVLNQLGVAADLVRILFTGFVAMLALAGGLAFGLGGKELASEILRGLKDKLTK
ncbi:MAG: hypothetical protein M1352_00540 [Patescibacteria group bacterium]|nr:hypothetical protein [Patescibacteria group bacterium]